MIYRTFIAKPVPRTAKAKPDFIPSWRDALPIGIRVGDSTARATIVEFVDLECPPCRGFQRTVRELLAERASSVSVVYVSFPLPMHRFALSAARAADCADKQGDFRKWMDEVFEKQDSLGMKSWGSLAHEAGIRDTARIARCATDPRPVERIVAGRALGTKISVSGTPTVIVNGWRFPDTPSKEELERAIEAVNAGRAPFDSSRKQASK